MANETLHDLTAAYALDALDPADEREYEQHLATCERCRAELAALEEATAALAFASPAPAPPPALRARILEQARSERSKVVPLRPRRLTYALGAVAAVAASVAVALGIWAASLSNQLEQERSALDIVGDPQARLVPLRGVNGRLVVRETGDAALVVAGLDRAPEGKTYEIWVIRERPRAAGLFAAGEGRQVVALTRKVSPGSTVAVTLEREGGVQAPTTPVLFQARA